MTSKQILQKYRCSPPHDKNQDETLFEWYRINEVVYGINLHQCRAFVSTATCSSDVQSKHGQAYLWLLDKLQNKVKVRRFI